MIFPWKRTSLRGRRSDERARLRKELNYSGKEAGLIRFEDVSLAPAIQNLSLEIPLGAWIVLYGEDDFAKALFCDLCFSYIHPESGRVHPVLKGSDVSFLGRSNTTYGNYLSDHLQGGVREHSRELTEFVIKQVLSARFHRHLDPANPLAFRDGKKAQELDLDERDFLEIAEANLVLQKRPAAVVDTTSDFYQIALEQGFRHSALFLESQRTVVWIVNEEARLPEGSRPWAKPDAEGKKISLSFPSGSRAGYIN
jgi:energy-coupling factor transporter ATP-binding protein EcfA2